MLLKRKLIKGYYEFTRIYIGSTDSDFTCSNHCKIRNCFNIWKLNIPCGFRKFIHWDVTPNYCYYAAKENSN